MELICLSQGKGFYYPPCHVLDFCGFRVLLDCPIDLSSLAIFSPVPTDSPANITNETCTCSVLETGDLESNVERRSDIVKPLDANSLICAEPYYKTVRNLLLLDISFIDLVLISSPMGILGLPFLTRNKEFSAKVYVTEAAVRLGKLMMEDLVALHKEFQQFYGPSETGAPQWMKWEELELLPLELKRIASGADGTEFGCWMPLYSAADVNICLTKVQSLKYGEETCYNGILIFKAFSSGLEIGSCNWSITGPKGSIAYVSGSVLTSAIAMSFNYSSLQDRDVILYSDFSLLNAPGDNSCSSLDADVFPNLRDDVDLGASTALVDSAEYLEEMEKFDFICSCSVASVKAGGSVLIPIGCLGIILCLLERFALVLEDEKLKVPIFIVSSVAEELMTFSNVIPEWLCMHRQEQLYSGQPLFTHVEMLKDGRLHLFPSIHSLKLLTIWQEPCIVFCPHSSLRFGPVVPLLRRWREDGNSLLVMEEAMDANLSLLPFKPMAMKVLQCSFISGIPLQKTRLLLEVVRPRHVLFPEVLRNQVGNLGTSFSFDYYSENEKVHIPMTKDAEVDIDIELATQLPFTTLKQLEMNIARLKGDLVIEQGRYRISIGNEQVCSHSRPVVHFGRIELDALSTALQKFGMDIKLDKVRGDGGLDEASLLHVLAPSKALIEVTDAKTLITTADKRVACLISEAVCSILVCI